MSFSILCDGCDAILSRSQFGRTDQWSGELPDHTWHVNPPGPRDALRRYEHVVHACSKPCLQAWLRKKDSPNDRPDVTKGS